MNWVTFVGKRVLRMVASLIIVSIITFTLLQLAPGNFVDIQAAGGGGGMGGQTQETAGEFNRRYGPDVPAWQQYLTFMKGAVTWDLGPSYRYPSFQVQDLIAQAFPISATLAVLATILALIIAIPMGTIAALRQRSFMDTGSMFLLTMGHALPSYLTGLFLVLVFAGWLQILPAAGWKGPENMILPILALAIGPVASLARYVRSSILETLREEYVTAALAKGGKYRVVIVQHVLRNSLIPLVTVLGPMLASLMTGTVFIETMFRIPGLGLTFTQSAASRDMPLLMGTTLFFAVILMVTNFIVDIIYGVLDPRIRVENRRSSRGNRNSNSSDEVEGDVESGRSVGAGVV